MSLRHLSLGEVARRQSLSAAAATLEVEDPVAAGFKRAHLKDSAILITPTDVPGKVFIQVICHILPHIRVIPDTLIDLCMRNFCFLLMEEIRK